jgi:hypothetical protein
MENIPRLYKISPVDVMHKTFFVVATDPTSAQRLVEKAYYDWDYGEFQTQSIECIAETDQYSKFNILL